MLDNAVARYKRVITTTSSPGELLLALYAGLFRFLRGARQCLERGQRSAASELLSPAHKIVGELDLALDAKVAPELCANLSGVYGFCMDRILQASVRGSIEAVDEVIRVLTPLHEAWLVAVPEAARERR
jgi:flagellar protein FliS